MKTIAATNQREAGVGTGESKASHVGLLVALSLSILIASLGTSIANVSLATLATAFNASFQAAQWIVLAYLLTLTSLVVSVGRLGDMVGRRRLLLIGIGLFTIASLLSGLSPLLWMLIAARALQGVGAAIMLALTMAFVGQTVPKERTGRAMGLLGTMSAIGTALGPTLGGVLTAGLGWRAIFLVNVPLGVLTFLLAHRYLPNAGQCRITKTVGFDKIGTVLLAFALTSYSLAMTLRRGDFGLVNCGLLVASALGASLFLIVEKRAKFPLIQPSMFRNAALSRNLATSVVVSSVVMATLVVGPFYLSRALGLDAMSVGLIMSVGPVVAALTGVPAGRLTDRFGAGGVTTIGLAGMAVGSILLAAIPLVAGVVGYVAPIAIMTAGYGLFQTANNTAVLKNIQADQRGVVSGMVNLARNLGLITGASVMGAVFAHASGAMDITAASREAVNIGMRATFAVAGVLVLSALTLSIPSSKRSGAVTPSMVAG